MRRAPKRYGRRIDAPPADIDKSTPDASVAAVVQQACKKPRECVDNQPAASQHTRPAWLAVRFARVAELVDALASGASGGNSVEVRVLSRAPTSFDDYRVGHTKTPLRRGFLLGA